MKADISFRRNHARRQKERRTNPFAFNSPEWIEVMMKNFALWPKHDRREGERRSCERRSLDRRSQRRHAMAARHAHRSQRFLADDILAEDEKKMIMDLFRER